MPWGKDRFYAAHFNEAVVDTQKGYLYIEGDSRKSMVGWDKGNEQPEALKRRSASAKKPRQQTKYIMNYALFPVIAATQALAIDFLQEIGLPNKLGQCTLHLHDTPYYLRPHCDVSELDCVVVIIQILGTSLLQVDHKTTTKQKVGEQCKGEKEFIAQCNAQFEAAKERSIPHCSGEAPTNRKDFLAAKQQHIEDSSKDYSALMMTPGSVAVLESGHLIPHASTKASAGVSKQNAVLIFYCPKHNPYARCT